MYTIDNILKTLYSYNLSSNKYGPSIYQKDDKLGICMDIKDPTFGYLTRAFTFSDITSLEEFLRKYTWYKENKSKYNVILTFDKYNTSEPKIKYIFNDQELSLSEMLNLKITLKENEDQLIEENNSASYLINIRELTNYLINLKRLKEKTKNEKNSLKIQENELKYELLLQLTTYYGKERTITKKAVSLENISTNKDIELLQNNLKNIETKPYYEIEGYLKSLIDITKQEELDDSYILNIYSNKIYKYNIEILNKQIEFVKNKIISEKNFNLKGSKIHNIDEELKSFLKTDSTPLTIETFINDTKTKIIAKYDTIKDIKDAFSCISGTKIDIPELIKKDYSSKNNTANLINGFNAFSKETQASLILYNSFYKNICNFIINNNYPSIDDIKKHFDLTNSYQYIESLVYNENNSHYLVNYFFIIDFTDLTSYINSIIKICQKIEETNIILNNPIKAFYTKDNNLYKQLTLNPIYSNSVSIIEIPKNTNLIFIPEKIEIDEISQEMYLISHPTIYLKGNIIDTPDILTVHKYHKITEKYHNSDIIITTDLKLDKEINFHTGTIEGG